MRRFIVLAIILFGLLLRLYNYYNLFYFAIDEEKASYIIKGIIDGTHFPTVGHPSSVGFRLGPLLYYLIAPFYNLFSPDPIVWGYVSVFASIFSMILLYTIGSIMSKKTGWIAFILYAFSYLNTLYDRRGWQVSFHSLIALIVLYSLILIKRKRTSGLYVLMLALIAASQFEVATILFIPLAVIVLFGLKIAIPKKQMIICIVIFFLSQTGLFIFDVRHQFLNTRYLINYFNPEATERIAKNVPLEGNRTVYLAHNLIPSTFSRLLFASSEPNIAIQYANCPQYLSYKQNHIHIVLKIAVIGIFVWFFISVYRKRKQHSETELIQKIIAVYIFILFSGIAVYTYGFHGEMAEYYLASSFAYFFLIVAFVLSTIVTRKYPRYLVFLFLFFFMVDNGNKLFKSYNPYGLWYKEQAVHWVGSITKNEPFILDSFQTCWSTGGYRYLFTHSRNEPGVSYMDQYLSEYYFPDTTATPQYSVTILTPELIMRITSC